MCFPSSASSSERASALTEKYVDEIMIDRMDAKVLRAMDALLAVNTCGRNEPGALPALPPRSQEDGEHLKSHRDPNVLASHFVVSGTQSPCLSRLGAVEQGDTWNAWIPSECLQRRQPLQSGLLHKAVDDIIYGEGSVDAWCHRTGRRPLPHVAANPRWSSFRLAAVCSLEGLSGVGEALKAYPCVLLAWGLIRTFCQTLALAVLSLTMCFLLVGTCLGWLLFMLENQELQ